MSIFLINKNLVKAWHLLRSVRYVKSIAKSQNWLSDWVLCKTEYICIDEQLPTERFTDDEIIATVQNVEDEEDEEDKEKSDKEYVPQSMISLKTALTSVDNLMRFVYQFCVHWNQKFRATKQIN